MEKKRIFVINPGSTSTKIALFENEQCLFRQSLPVDTEAVKTMYKAVEQLPMRLAAVEDFIRENGIDFNTVDIIACRGGMIPPCRNLSGKEPEGVAFQVNRLMVDVVANFAQAQHAASLACMIGLGLSERYGGIPCIIYDSVLSYEYCKEAQYTGLPGFMNNGSGHVLNGRIVSRKAAEKMGRNYEDCNFVLAHLGGGCTVQAHRRGKIIDSTYDVISPERLGRVQSIKLAALCYSGKYTKSELDKMMTGGSGFIAYTGTSDCREIARRAENGDETAAFMFDLMAYQLAKAIGEMAGALEGNVDRVVFTGGIANESMLMDKILPKVRYLAPAEVIPGELEMEALAMGGQRVAMGLEKANEFNMIPEQFGTLEEFYDAIK